MLYAGARVAGGERCATSVYRIPVVSTARARSQTSASASVAGEASSAI